MKIQKITNWLFWLIVLISTIGMVYFGVQKEGYHVDEMYSYGLANSEYLPFMHFGKSDYNVKDWMLEYGAGESFGDLFHNMWNDFQILKEHDFHFYNTPIYRDYQIAQENSADTRTTTWVSGQEYKDYLGINAGNTFNFASVYYNQRGDVHPPFYYMVLHSICSIFQGTFSKWYAMSINIVALLLVMWLLYRMVNKYIGDEKMALLTVALYGFSNGFFTTALYLRMYALLTLMVVTFCYMHLHLLTSDYVMKKKDVLKLAAVTLLGYMTHYYFVLYAIAIAVVFVLWMCAHKKWKSLVQYLLTLVASAIIGLCIWPFAVKHVFGGYRGQASLQVFASGEIHWIKMELILRQGFQQLFAGQWWIPMTCLIILIVGAIYYRKQAKVLEKGTILVVPILFYIACTAQIVPFYADRYIMCTYPFWCMLAVFSAWLFAKMMFQFKPLQNYFGEAKQNTVCFCVMAFATAALCIANNGFAHTPGYLGTGGQELATVPKNTHCVYVLPDGTWNESAEDTLLLSKCEQVAVCYYSNLSSLKDTYKYKEGDTVMVIISHNFEEMEVLEEVMEILDISDMHIAFQEDSYNFLRIYLQ